MRARLEHLKWPLSLALAALFAGAGYLALTRGEAILLDLSAAVIACF